MQPVRRRKKRPNYGIRTVEVSRGRQGFGFTISGQQPCILSCIVPNSPAEQAGLRPGDYLIAVSGHNVSKMPHDDVVKLIGNCYGTLKLQIAENYYSDSSEEDFSLAVRNRPKYVHRYRHNSTNVNQSNENKFANLASTSSSKTMESNVTERIIPLPNFSRYPENENKNETQFEKELFVENITYRCLVGYVGSIEMPLKHAPNSYKQIVSGCIKRLRAEKRTHAVVTMIIYPCSLRLYNESGSTIAVYPGGRVTHCSGTTEGGSSANRQYFGIVTVSVGEHPSNSCHVFVTLPTRHQLHLAECEKFGFECTPNEDGACAEFPANCDKIIEGVRKYYDERGVNSEGDCGAASPLPSVNSTTTSNSDSGIGFRDESGEHSDRILLVDIPNQRLHIRAVGKPSPQYVDCDEQLSPNSGCQEDFVGSGASNSTNRLEEDCVGSRITNAKSRLAEDFVGSRISNSTSRLLEEDLVGSRITNRSNPSGADCVGSGISNAKSRLAEDFVVGSRISNSTSRLREEDFVGSRISNSTSRLREEDFVGSRILNSTTISNQSNEYFGGSGISNSTSRPNQFGESFVGRQIINSTSRLVDNFVGRQILDSYGRSKSHEKLFDDSSRSSLGCSLDNLFVDAKKSDSYFARKLSPKVFDCALAPLAQISYSMEDLKPCVGETVEQCLMKNQSMQDLPGTSDKQNDDVGRVASWATSFEKLLQDVVGIHAFAEFLKKEFSSENIYFWAACEKYRHITKSDMRKIFALWIYKKYLGAEAIEPVNITSVLLSDIEQKLPNAESTLFDDAQRHICNLMKFDSFTRFLKSDIYKESLKKEEKGAEMKTSTCELDFDLLIDENSVNSLTEEINLCSTPQDDSKRHRSSKRRRSLIPWPKSRYKTRSSTAPPQSQTPAPANQTPAPANQTPANQTPAPTPSLTPVTWDTTLQDKSGSTCRVGLPNGCVETMLVASANLGAYDAVSEFLQKHKISLASFQIILMATNKVLDKEEKSSALIGQEIKIEPRIEFALDLPDRTSLTIKTKPSHSLGAVLAPILLNHGYNLQMVTLCLISDNEVLEPDILVNVVNGKRVQILTRSTPTPTLQGWNVQECGVKGKHADTLNEITNKVFEELLNGKANTYSRDEMYKSAGSIKSEDCSSEHSSGLISRFLRKDSFNHRDKKRNKKNNDLCPPSAEKKSKLPSNILPSKWNPTQILDNKLEKDVIYEGLKRAQRGRLEDQRGTEINNELPDFLKNNENAPNTRRKLRKSTSNYNIQEEKAALRSRGSNAHSDHDEQSDHKDEQRVVGTFFKSKNQEFKGNEGGDMGGDMGPPPPLPPKPSKCSSWDDAMMGKQRGCRRSIYFDRPSSSIV